MDINNLKKADIFEYLPNHPEEFDMIIANDIIEHLRKDEVFNFLDIIMAALRPGGKILISAPNAGSLFGSSSTYIDFTHELSFTPESLTQVLRVCGFKDVHIYGDGPVAHDFRSTIRVWLWHFIKGVLKGYLAVERGTGRGLWKHPVILEPRIFAVARKSD